MSKDKITLCILILLSFISIFFVYHDDFLYSKEIMKITSIKTNINWNLFNYLVIFFTYLLVMYKRRGCTRIFIYGVLCITTGFNLYDIYFYRKR